VDYVPMTQQERENVERMTTCILNNTPQSMAGNDQDWDDAIRAAYKVACWTWCEPRLFEHRTCGGDYARPTGNWRPSGGAK